MLDISKGKIELAEGMRIDEVDFPASVETLVSVSVRVLVRVRVRVGLPRAWETSQQLWSGAQPLGTAPEVPPEW